MSSGIPVVIKHIAEPELHSMPTTALHPSGHFFAAQSQDNQVLVFTAETRYKLNRKKRFTGHATAGYACQLAISPDGQFLCSGDSQGRLFFWDWATARCFKTIKAHDQVCMGVAWHPADASRVVTCSWDGAIKLWD